MKIAAYYNEIDPKAAAWLRELISAGQIAPGEVDERSITDVRPADLLGFTQCHFFAGIGGWSLALRIARIPDGFPVWTGSCPCQPFSAAGKQLGEADERHLWPEFFRLIRAGKPDLIAGEQVERAIGLGWLDGVCADLEREGYACGAAVLGAHSVGAPHIRQRLYWMAHSQEHRREIGPLLHDVNQEGDSRFGDGSAPRGLAHMQRQGLEGHTRDGDKGNQPGRLDAHASGSIAQGGGTGNRRVADTSSLPGAEHEHESREEVRRRAPEANSPECGGLGKQRARPWDCYDTVPCRDGKARRIEPGSFPLAHGVPGRVGLLRGYGNAIVPQVAAEFILASLDALKALGVSEESARIYAQQDTPRILAV